jgi:hypothetical protein
MAVFAFPRKAKHAAPAKNPPRVGGSPFSGKAKQTNKQTDKQMAPSKKNTFGQVRLSGERRNKQTCEKKYVWAGCPFSPFSGKAISPDRRAFKPP